MQLDIISPEANFFSGEIISVTVPGADGEFQIFNNHAPIVSVLTSGKIKIHTDFFEKNTTFQERFSKEANKYVLPIESGTLEMKDNKIVILVG